MTLLRNSLLGLALLLMYAAPVHARYRAYGYCEQGNQTVSVAGFTSSTSTPVMRSFPSCTVTVYLTGTLTLATLYSDNSGTALSNPFSANGFGYWYWYADNGRYDVKLSGGGLSAPLTLGDIALSEPSGGGSVTSFNGRTGAVVPASGDYTFSLITGNITTHTHASGSQGGQITLSAFGSGSKSGNTLVMGTVSGSPSSGKCLEWDASGNITTAASNLACGAGSGGVTSFNGRTGVVVPATNDYSFSQISGAASFSGPVTSTGSGTGSSFLLINSAASKTATWRYNNDATLVLIQDGTTRLSFNPTGPDLTVTDNIIPNSTETIGKSGNRWSKIWVTDVDISGTLTYGFQNVLPSITNTYGLGDVSHKWLSLYVMSANFYGSSYISSGGTLNIQSGGSLAVNPGSTFSVGSHYIPQVDNTYDIAATGNRMRKVWTTDIDISGTCTGCSSLPVADTTSIVKGSIDPSKLMRFEVDGYTTATTRVITPPDADITLAATNLRQTFSASSSGNSIIRVSNTSTSGYSSVEFLDSSGISKGLVGFANSAAGVAPSKFIIGTNGANDINLYTNGSLTSKWDTSGNYVPLSTISLGESAAPFLTVYATNINVQTSGGIQGSGATLPILTRTTLTASSAGNSLLRISNTSTSGFSAVEFLDNSGSSKGLIGYANGSAVVGPSSIIIGSNGASEVQFYVNGTLRAKFDTSGNLLPVADNTYDFGSSSNTWKDVHLQNLTMYAKPEFHYASFTSAVAASFGSTCPAVDCTAAYTWIQAVSSDGSTVYIPVWK